MNTQGWFGSRGLLIASAFAGLSACGSGDPSPTYGYGDWNQPRNEAPANGLDESRANALRTSVRCAAGECNPSVAMLVATTENGIGACTASLVAPNLLVTNAHCVPDDLRNRANADASGRIYFFFPAMDDSAEIRAEAETVVTSRLVESRTASPDYAYIRVKSPIARPLMPVAEEGFTSGETYTLTKIDPTPQPSGTFTGLMRKTNCVAIGPTIYTPSDDRPMTANTAFHDCDIEHGNSGSAIVDSLGRIHGVIQSMYTPSLASILLGSNAFLDGTPRYMGFGTNLGCVDFPEVLPGHAIPASCTADPAKTGVSADLAARLEKEVIDRSTGFVPAPLSDVFEWKVAVRETAVLRRKLAFIVPKCFRDEKLWAKKYKGFLGFGTKHSETAEFSVTEYPIKTGINRYLQIDGRISSEAAEAGAMKLEFSPHDLTHKGTSRVTMKQNEPNVFGRETYLDADLGPCSN